MRLQKFLWPLTGLLVLGFGMFQNAHAEDIRTLIEQRTIAGAEQNHPPGIVPYNYLVSIEHTSQEGSTEKNFSIEYRVNPAADPGNRLTFITGVLEDLPEDFQAEIVKFDNEKPVEKIAEDFWCSGSDGTRITDQYGFSPDALNIVRENGNEAIIALDTAKIKEIMDGDEDDGMPKKLLKRLAAEVTVSKPDLVMEHMRIWLTKPTTMKLIAKLKAMEIEQSCAKAPNGFYYVARNVSHVQAKALGKSIRSDTTISISDLKPLK